MQIDVLQPKVTVICNVDAQTLIKKLAKAGKTGEAWPSESQKPVKEEKKVNNSEKLEICTTNAKDKDTGKKPSNKECKCSTCCIAIKSKEEERSGAGDDEKEEKNDTKVAKNGTSNGGSMSEFTKSINPVPQPGIVHEAANVVPYMPYYYAIESPMVHLGAYLGAPAFYVTDHYLYKLPVCRVPVESMAPRLTDYFNDENTNGCSVM